MWTRENPLLRIAFFTLSTALGAVHGHVAGEERGAGPFQDVHDVHAFAHQVVLEHPVGARIRLAPCGVVKPN